MKKHSELCITKSNSGVNYLKFSRLASLSSKVSLGFFRDGKKLEGSSRGRVKIYFLKTVVHSGGYTQY